MRNRIAFKKNILLFALGFFATLLFAPKVFGASFNFAPPSPALDQECIVTMDVYVDVTGQDSNSADIEITYNPSQITVLDADPLQAGVQIIPGNAYEDYFANLVDTSNGIIRIGAGSYLTTLTTNALFASIQFKSNIGVTSSLFHIVYTGFGDTLDSNIAETGTANDLLNSTTDGTPTFNVSACTTNLDSAAPVINFVAPVNGQTNVSVTQPIIFTITDDNSGSNLTTLSISVNGTIYNYGSPYISVSGSPNNYTITFNPPIAWDYSSNNIIQVSIQDNTGKLGTGAINFTTEAAPPVIPPVVTPPVSSPETPPSNPPPATSIPPEIIFISPVDGQTNVDPATNIVIQISEGEFPIDFSTVTFNINGEIIGTNDPRVNVYNNNGKYIFTIDLSTDFQPGQVVNITVSGKDLKGNTFTRNGTFTIATPIDVIVNTFIGKDIFPQFQGTFFGDVINTIGLSGVISLLSLLLFIIGLLVTFSNVIGNLFTFIALIVNKRKRPWGVILDSKTQKPVAFATIRLIVAGSMEVVAQTVSALDGTYGFPITDGNYILEVRHPQYKIFKTKIEIRKDEEGYVLDIELVSLLEAGSSRTKLGQRAKSTFISFFNKFRDLIFILGFFFTVLGILIDPSVWNWLMLIIFIIILILNIIVFVHSRNMFSEVEDAKTGQKVPFAIVKVYKLRNFQNIDTLVCNGRGYFDYFGEPGEYGIVVAAKGYKFPSSKQKDLPVIENMYSGMVKSKLTKGKNKLRLFLDEDDSISIQINNSDRSALQSPFG